MQWLKTFFEESPGFGSSTRLNILIILLNGIGFADFVGIYSILHGKETITVVCAAFISIMTSVVLPLIAWKQISKAQENKEPK